MTFKNKYGQRRGFGGSAESQRRFYGKQHNTLSLKQLPELALKTMFTCWPRRKTCCQCLLLLLSQLLLQVGRQLCIYSPAVKGWRKFPPGFCLALIEFLIVLIAPDV